jgi:mannosyltransferase
MGAKEAVAAGRSAASAAPADDPASRPGRSWTGVAVGLGAGLLAFFLSWHPSLWTDEAATISAARRSLSDLWAMLGTIDLVHGAYYGLMHGWIELFGASAFSIRVPSAIAVGLAAWCVYRLGVRLRDRRFGLWAAGVFAVLPRVCWAGAEARPYGFTALVAAAATLVLLVALDRPRRLLLWVGYGVLVVAGVLVNVYVVLLLAAHLVSVLWDRRLATADRVRWLVAAAAAALLAGPFLLAAREQSGQLSDRPVGLAGLAQNVVVSQWFLGDTPTTTTGADRTDLRLGDVGSWWQPAALALALVGWMLALTAVIRLRSTLAGGASGRPPVLVWTVPWIVLPTAVIGLWSVAIRPVYGPRYLTFAAPALALLLAAGLTALPSRRLRAAAAAVLVLVALPVYVSQRQLYGKNSSDWVSVARYIGARAMPGDGVYFAPRYDLDLPTVGQTTRGIAVAYPDDFAGLIDLTLLRTPAQTDNLVGESRYLRQSGAELARVRTVWVVRRDDSPDAAADDAYLSSAGFVRTDSWQGPLDTVVRLERS